MTFLGTLGERLRRNPYPVYSLLRRVRPVLHDRMHNVWLLFDYESVKRALNDHAVFSSAVKPPGGSSPPDWLIFHDEPRHAKLRRILAQAFTPKSIAALEPRVRELSGELLAALTPRGEMDFVTEYAEPLPTMVIAGMIGIPPEDRPTFIRWAHAIMNLGYAVTGGERAARASREYFEVSDEMKVYLASALAARRRVPTDDLLTRLVEAEVDGDRLTDDEILGFVKLLLSAGTETTTNTLANAIVALLDYPEQLALLRREPERMPQAIEEVIRYRSPVQMVFRTTRTEVELCGKRLPAGALVLPVIGSANHDAHQFPNADRFDITRDTKAHVAFGHGIHFCIGAALARLELRVALPELLERLPGLARSGTRHWAPRDAPLVHGPKHLALRFLSS